MELEEVKKEIKLKRTSKDGQEDAPTTPQNNDKMMMFEEIDNMVLRGGEREKVKWCQQNKVCDEIAKKLRRSGRENRK